MKNKNPSRLALGVALFITGSILLFKGQNISQDISNSFAQEPVLVKGFTEEQFQSSQIPKRILIPGLGVNLEIGNAKIVNGYWEVFDDKAGWGEGSGFPGQPGNQVIFAHAKEGLLLPLQSIEVSEKIYVLTDSEWFGYEVFEIKEVNPNQSEVIAPTQDEILTLYTCSGYKDSKRLIVIAKPI
jgi:LPXTG-site transpeptidase (sortase) family protein